MADTRAGDHSEEQDGTRRMLKRRGLIAGAAALAVGMTARTTAPVAAGNPDHFPLIIGESNTSALQTLLSGNYTPSGNQPMFLVSNTSGTGSAINGIAGGSGFGSFATSVSGAGAYGRSGSIFTDKQFGGVVGENTASGNGVSGFASGIGTGVLGTSTGTVFSHGVSGVSDLGSGVLGLTSGSGTGVAGSSASGSGVYGQTTGAGQVAGVYGASTTAYGIIGNTTAAGYSGLTGISSTPGVAALGATATVATAYAAFFTGTTIVNGNFAVTGSKSVAAAHPDGTHRLLYCVESPEAWFEDLGKTKLVNGKADVLLDADFVALVHSDDYHIFLTTYGPSQGVDVVSQHTNGFSVQERNKGTGTIMLGWRVMAKRKENPGKRLEKFAMPTINHPDPNKLRKPEFSKQQR